ncbi:MAG: hypothetical protein ACLUJG_19075 [Lawsonibacter sp.]
MEFLEASIFQKGYIDGITILNLDGEILFSAKFNKKLSNLDEAQQLIGQNFLDVYPNLTPQSSTLYRAMQFGRPVYEEKQYLKKRGKGWDPDHLHLFPRQKWGSDRGCDRSYQCRNRRRKRMDFQTAGSN